MHLEIHYKLGLAFWFQQNGKLVSFQPSWHKHVELLFKNKKKSFYMHGCVTKKQKKPTRAQN